MAACDVLYHDPAHAGPSADGWRPCTAPGQVWTDPDQVLRFVCPPHRRQLNRALQTIVLARLRDDPQTRAYAARRCGEGKSIREIRRCLKRAVARQLFKLLERYDRSTVEVLRIS